MLIGDIAFIVGSIGLFIYICMIIVKHATQAGKLSDRTRRYEGEGERLRIQREELQQQRSEAQPKMDEIITKVIALREERDRLLIQYEDMQAEAHSRQIVIKSKRH
ncbi:MAG: ABC-type phosphate transport system auxiliary subunit [Candidatus Latescibacterota bacterium]